MKQTLADTGYSGKGNTRFPINAAKAKRKLKDLLCYVLFFAVSAAQVSAQRELRKADRHYNNLEYYKAGLYYRKAFNKKPGMKPAMMAANCYRLINSSFEAEYWYEKALSYPGHEPLLFKYYADALKKNGKYEEARKFYLLYGQLDPGQAKVSEVLAESCDKALEWLKNPLSVEVVKEDGLNSTNADFCPVFYKDGLVFTSDRIKAGKSDLSGWTGKPFFSLYYANYKYGQWQPAKELDTRTINTGLHNGPAAFSPSGDTIYFTRVNRIKKRVKARANDPTSWFKFRNQGFVNHNELYYAVSMEEGWGEPVPLPFNNAYEYSVGHPALSNDGNILYFVSDKPGGFGGSDIYFSEKQIDGSWGDPVNMGGEINSPGMEAFPVIGPDGTLYFSSDGHIGLGGLDIFSSVLKDGGWEKPQNLKFPFNSSQDDFGILFNKNGETGYFSSGRESEYGYDNIFSFYQKAEPKDFVIAGIALAEEEKEPLTGAIVDVIESHTKAVIVKEVMTDENGRFYATVKKDDYFIAGQKNNYNEVTVFIKQDEFQKDTLDLVLFFEKQEMHAANVPELKEFNANTIYFDLDKATIRAEAKIELDKIVVVMLDNDEIRVELSAHCDCRASEQYNMRLAQRRAKSAVDYLVSKGVDKSNISAMAYGKRKPVNKCTDGVVCTEEEHQQNRRIEVKLIFQQNVPVKYTDTEVGEFGKS